ncbi:MAG: hypothetical protein KAV87_53620, partial [Desulfobacteraceae bacterium]|nr:hypothetical protein [Desulfobacteraceae bacterium]
MWFFVPALLIGVYRYFREQSWREPKKFFTTALIALNILLMILLHCNYGYMSRRHTLTLVVFTIFYVPAGLQMLASLLQGKFSKKTEQSSAGKANKQFWFLVLLVIGISICIPKLLTPIRAKKQSYRDAAQWLARHTNENDIIAVPDTRISFYSGRKGAQYDGQTVPKEARYIVKLFKSEKDMLANEEIFQAEKLFSTEGNGKKSKVAIYRQAR